MKRKKDKGSISIVFALMIVTLFTLGLVFYDFSRLSQSREDIDRTVINAMDSALVEYDETLFNKYHLMALSDEKNAASIVEQRINISLNRKNAQKDSSSYHLLSVKSISGGKLSEEKAIKRAILRSHQKKFIANKLSDWLDKLEILEMIPEYAKSMKVYSKSIKFIAKLKNDYDDLRKKSENIAEKYQKIKGIDIKECVNTIIDLREQKNNLKERIRNLEERRAELYANITTSSEALAAAMAARAINSQISQLRRNIDEIEISLKKLVKTINTLRELVYNVKEYARKITIFTSDLSEKAADLRKDINEIDVNKNDKMQYIMDKVSEILLKIEKASTQTSSLAKSFESTAKELSEKIDIINTHLKNADHLSNSISIKITRIKDISAESMINTFGDMTMEGSGSISLILDFIWESIAGDYLPDFENLGELSEMDIANIPSKKYSFEIEERKNKNSKPSSDRQIADSSMGLYEEQSEANTDYVIAEKSNELFQKLIIADYAVETFNNVNSEKKDSNSPLKAEVEYLLSGNLSEKTNVLITQGKIYSLRMILNGISILIYKQVEINEMATSLSSFTGFLGYPLAYGLVSLGWSAIESAQDIKALNAGEKLPILKMKTEIKTDLANIVENASMETFKKSIREKAKKSLESSWKNKGDKKDLDTTKGKKKKNTKDDTDEASLGFENPLSMDYEDYLMLFLLLEDESETLVRISDLICIKEKVDTSTYSTVLHSKVKINIPLIFVGAMKTVDEDSKSSYLYEVEKIRGY